MSTKKIINDIRQGVQKTLNFLVSTPKPTPKKNIIEIELDNPGVKVITNTYLTAGGLVTEKIIKISNEYRKRVIGLSAY